MDFGTFDTVLVGCPSYNILIQGYSIQILVFYYSKSSTSGLLPLQNMQSTCNIFDHFLLWYCGDQ